MKQTPNQQQSVKPSMKRKASAPVDDSKTTVKKISEKVRSSSKDFERIQNPKAYETMFAVPVASKFGGIKRKSQMMQKVSDMHIDDDFSSSITLILDGVDKLWTFQQVFLNITSFSSTEIHFNSQVEAISRKCSSKLCLLSPEEIQLIVLSHTTIRKGRLNVDHTGIALALSETIVSDTRRPCPNFIHMELAVKDTKHDILVKMPYLENEEGQIIHLNTDALCTMMQNKYSDWEEVVSFTLNFTSLLG